MSKQDRTSHVLALNRAIEIVTSDLDRSTQRLEATLLAEEKAGEELAAMLNGYSVESALAPCQESTEAVNHSVLLDALIRQASSPPHTPHEIDKFLRDSGVDPDLITLEQGTHFLDATDVGAAIAIGIVGALVPSWSPTGSHTGNVAGAFQRNQDHGIKHAVDSILGETGSSLIDSLPGQLHRFSDHSHDLAILLEGTGKVSGFGLNALMLLRHLFVDAFGATGVPLPGSTYIREWLGLFDPSDSRAARLHSRLAAYRHTDLVATLTTSAGLALYGWWREIPEGSLRRPKLGVIAHGITACAVGMLASVNPLIAARRSMVNWVSVGLFTKNTIALTLGAQRLRVQTEALRNETTMLLDGMLARTEG